MTQPSFKLNFGNVRLPAAGFKKGNKNKDFLSYPRRLVCLKSVLFETLLSTCQPRLFAAGARRKRRSNVTHMSGNRGLVVSNDRSGSAVLGNATGGFGSEGN